MSAKLISLTLQVSNMTCSNCENIIERKLLGATGIYSAKASYSKGTVDLTYDETVINLNNILKILKEEGYHASQGRKQSIDKPFDYTNLVGIIIIGLAIYMIASHFGLLRIFNSFPVAKEGMGYGLLFLIGVLTSVHCIAMCGGICLSQCVTTQRDTAANKLSALRPSLLYNLGRVVSYTVIGGIIGAIGSVVSFSGTMKGIVQIVAGIFMVIMGFNMLNLFPALRKFNPRMPKMFARKIYAQRNSNSPLYIGLLNGLMPCGPLQAMQLYALSTGSPAKGALAMFLFSVGTVPLMFLVGALSSILSKKFTAKMMTASAVLVVFLGIFMLNNGFSLSGILLPTLPTNEKSQASEANTAIINGDVQEVVSGITSGSYEPIIVMKGIPVKWTIRAEQGDINGCNNTIIVQKYGIQKALQVGDNVIEFTPTESGTISFSCWMGMIRSKIIVVDNLNNVDESAISNDTDNNGISGGVGGGCCGAGVGVGYDNSSDNYNGNNDNSDYDYSGTSCCE